MSGICDTCKRNNDCRKPIGGIESCRLYVSGKESNYSKLFGTPERAARTIVDSCNDDYDYGCGGCPVARVNCKCGDYDTLLEWLLGDAE